MLRGSMVCRNVFPLKISILRARAGSDRHAQQKRNTVTSFASTAAPAKVIRPNNSSAAWATPACWRCRACLAHSVARTVAASSTPILAAPQSKSPPGWCCAFELFRPCHRARFADAGSTSGPIKKLFIKYKACENIRHSARQCAVWCRNGLRGALITPQHQPQRIVQMRMHFLGPRRKGGFFPRR